MKRNAKNSFYKIYNKNTSISDIYIYILAICILCIMIYFDFDKIFYLH